MRQRITEFERAGITVVAISADTPEASAGLASRMALTFPLVSDENLATIRAYGLEDGENGVAWPAVFIVDRQGVVRWRWVATSYKARPTADELLTASKDINIQRAP